MPTRALPATMAWLIASSEKTRLTIVKSSEFSKSLEQRPALLGAGLVEDDGADVADVGVDGVAEHEQLDDRDEQREEQRLRVAQDVETSLRRPTRFVASK